jgi:glycosyltransferase involved in cell wall biosynthesis
MPAFNEAGRIESFIRDLNLEIKGVDLSFIVVDDASSDSTLQSLEALTASGINLAVHQNLANQGHGPSTLTALTLAVKENPDCILMVDGDGHFECQQVYKILSFFLENNFGVVEGFRSHRNDPLFRKVVSLLTRWLVAFKSGKRPRDANTPLRLYTSDAAKLMLTHVPRNSLIPNLHISQLTRTLPLQFNEFEVKPIIRFAQIENVKLSNGLIGTSWGPSIRFLPNLKFIKLTVSKSMIALIFRI